MKNYTKIITLVLSLALVIGAAVAIGASADAAAPQVVAKNVKTDGNFCLMFAVDPATVAGENVTLKVYDKAPAEGVEAIQTITLAKTATTKIDYDKDGVENEDMLVFETKGVSAKDIADVWYYTVESAGVVSDADTYSVREYAFERLYGDNKVAATDSYGMKQKAFYLSILEVGSTAQDLLVNTKLEEEGKAPERLANEYSYAAIVNGSFGDASQKFVEIGDTLTLNANAGVYAWQVNTYGTNGVLLSKKNVALGSTVTVEGNTVVIPDPTYGTTPGKYFEQIGNQDYSFDNVTNPWADLVKNFRHTGGDSVTNKNYGYRITRVLEDGHGRVIGTGKEADDGNGATIYFPVQDLANGKGNVIVFEGEMCLDKGVYTYYDDEISATEALANAVYFMWLDIPYTDMHNKDWNSNGTRIASTGFNMVETDPTSLTNKVGGDGLRHYESDGDIQFKFGEWHQVCFELYMEEGKAIFYLDGEMTATWKISIKDDAVKNIQSMGICSMWRLTASELLLDNVFCGKIVKDYPLD